MYMGFAKWALLYFTVFLIYAKDIVLYMQIPCFSIFYKILYFKEMLFYFLSIWSAIVKEYVAHIHQ